MRDAVSLTHSPGWDEGVPQMSLGEKAVLTIPGYVILPIYSVSNMCQIAVLIQQSGPS
jgi:hypothetical protein